MPNRSLRIFIATVGSYGDIHPFLAIASVLQQRGHRVSFLAPAIYDTLAESLKIDFLPVGTPEQLDSVVENPDLWHPTRSLHVLAGGISIFVEPYYRAIEKLHEPGNTAIVMSSLAFGARIAQEKLKIPCATVHLAPSTFRSVIRPPYVPPAPIAAWQPMWLRRLQYFLIDRLILDRALMPVIEPFRKSLDLPPVCDIVATWMHSPDLLIGLFPKWFAAPAADWPPHTVLTGFPLYDEADVAPIDAELSKFLDAGDAPIAFTPGSAMKHGKEFFIAAVEICRRLNRRGVLMSRHSENIPANLPATIRHFEFAPFSRLLPRCCAIVHHGGIGTSAQGLSAGIPQLIMPMAFDQPDNAKHLIALGVAAAVHAKHFTAGRAVAALKPLLDNPQVTHAARRAAMLCAADQPLSATADAIEKLVN